MIKIRNIMPAVLSLAVLSCTQTAEPEGYGYVDISVVRDSSVDDVDITASTGSALTKAAARGTMGEATRPRVPAGRGGRT